MSQGHSTIYSRSDVESIAVSQWRNRVSWNPYLATLLVVVVCTLIAWGTHALGLTNANVVMVFLAGVALVAARFGHGPAIVSTILSVLVFDYFFVDPIYSFAPSDTQYFVDLFVMLGIALLISELTARLQRQLQASREKERRTAALYQLTRQLGEHGGTNALIQSAGRQLTEMFDSELVIYLADSESGLKACFGDGAAIAKEVPQQMESHDDGREQLVPLRTPLSSLGVLKIRPRDPQRFADDEELRLLETSANLIALSLEREQSLLKAHQAELQVQSEQIRNSLLSAVSHDMRSPLAMIAVSASSLLDGSMEQNGQPKQEMLQTVVDESNRLARQVDNLLEMARLNSGNFQLNCQWHVLEELIGVSLKRLRGELKPYRVHVDIPGDFPLLWVADSLLEQVFSNLLENAVRYTPPGTCIDISARFCGEEAEIKVSDNGPGLPQGSETKVFEKFFRGTTVIADGQRGVGLGLAICQGIVRAHGGTISAANRRDGGAEFTITLPCPGQRPAVNLEDALSTVDS